MFPRMWSQPPCRNRLVTIPSVAPENQLPESMAAVIFDGTAPHWSKNRSSAASPPPIEIVSSYPNTMKQATISPTVTIGNWRVGLRS